MAAAQQQGKGKARPRVQVFESEEALAVALADYVRHLSCQYVEEKGAFTVALSGGSLIRSLRKLVEPAFVGSVDWSKWHVFWVDERVVPKDHADSNYFLAYNHFLSKIPIPAGNVYTMNDALSAEAAADDYETFLKHLVKTNALQESNDTGFPKFDLVLLGMGPDGHIASLFPGHQLLDENKRWVSFLKDSPKPPPERITFTLPVLNSSANVALVVAGQAKAEAVREALGEGDHEVAARRLPVKMVSPEEGMLSWFLDKGAASKLDSS
ncbi:OLC1v1020911C1 [Oldenlandia corymbosa var. corymbosa]|uniref:Probable 6-phosphogluconolactonase n=1 Tax=Oldenlandia corymbosa var. corymbosa TaxID=529605 RepID=A0AAV1BUH9_OLDCO|nr:OLC1v1020911C1 [Oldenlandia corymbosa var. corymbosa]